MDEADCIDELVKWMRLNGFSAKGDRFVTIVAELGWQLHEREKQLQLRANMAEAEVRRLKSMLHTMREVIAGALA